MMAEPRFEDLQGWDVLGWSMPRNDLFKLVLADFRAPQFQKAAWRRGEAYFIEPTDLRFQVVTGTKNRVIISKVRQTTSATTLRCDFEMMQDGTIDVSCSFARLILMP